MQHLYWHMENVCAVEPLFKTEADINECFKNERTALKAMTVYREVCNKRVSECGDACEMRGNVFTDIVCKVAYRRHLMECDFRHHFIKILTNTGFRVEESAKTALGFGKEETKILDQRILEEKEHKIEAFIVKVRAGVPVPSDDAFETTALRHAGILQLPMEEEVIRCYKDEVFDEKPFQQHLNVRRLTESKKVFGDAYNAFMDGDHSFNATQTDLVRVAIFCDIIKKCVPGCSSVLELQVSLGSKDAVPIPEGVLKLWEVLNRGKKTKIPKNKKKLVQSVLDTSKSLFGHDYLDTEYTQPRRGGEKHSETCYTVNPEWLKRHMDLFRYSARSQVWKLDIEIAHRYDLIHAIDYSNPNTDATDQIHICEPMDCSKTPEDPELEQKRREEWADLAQGPPSHEQKKQQVSGQKKPKRAHVSKEDRLKQEEHRLKEENRLKAMRCRQKTFWRQTGC
jgi:hypothetical protein